MLDRPAAQVVLGQATPFDDGSLAGRTGSREGAKFHDRRDERRVFERLRRGVAYDAGGVAAALNASGRDGALQHDGGVTRLAPDLPAVGGDEETRAATATR